MAFYTSDKQYAGQQRIVVSIDLGTERSSVSYTYLYPGEKPEVRMVSKWPGQPTSYGDSKIPSLVAYRNHEAVYFGAEVEGYIDDDDYEVAKWFKLHLHPNMMRTSGYRENKEAAAAKGVEPPPLPRGVTIARVYAEFLRYLFEHTSEFFKGNVPNGARIWSHLKDLIVVVLAIPNGWSVRQETFLREAVVEAGLVSRRRVDENLKFASESEASVHFALAHNTSNAWMKAGSMFVLTVAGAATVDSTLYECKKLNPLKIEEVCASECVLAGSVFVDRAARTLLEEKLVNSRYGDQEYLDIMIEEFKRKTMCIFDGTQDSNLIHFGRNLDNDRQFNILKGRLILSKDEVRSTFDDVIWGIFGSCFKLFRGRKVKHLLLVGDFGESPFLRRRFKEVFGQQGVEVATLDKPWKKAIAEGALIWYIEQVLGTAGAARHAGNRNNEGE